MNLCCSCRLDFGSVAAFDAHRIGKHAYTFKEGLNMEPSREDGRRCLDEDEMRVAVSPAGNFLFALNAHGKWSLAAALKSAHEAFSARTGSEQGHRDGDDAA